LHIALSAVPAFLRQSAVIFHEVAVRILLRVVLVNVRAPRAYGDSAAGGDLVKAEVRGARCFALFFDPALIRDLKRAAAPPFSVCESTGTPKKALYLDKIA
jgi:hypothetical protein